MTDIPDAPLAFIAATMTIGVLFLALYIVGNSYTRFIPSCTGMNNEQCHDAYLEAGFNESEFEAMSYNHSITKQIVDGIWNILYVYPSQHNLYSLPPPNDTKVIP